MWILKARDLLRRYIELKKQATEKQVQFFDSTIPELEKWIDEYENTGKVSDSRAYEMVMGNE